MKKSKIAVAALAAICTLGAASCSKGGSESAAVATPGDSATINIRYVSIDSVLQNYTLAKELTAEQQKMLLEYQQLENSKGSELQRLQNTINQKLQSNGYLTEQSFKADQDALNQRANEAQNLLGQRQQQIQQVVQQQTLRVNDSIRNYMKELCAANNFDAVIDESVTYFVNPELDITAVVIEGLNKRYNPTDTTAKK